MERRFISAAVCPVSLEQRTDGKPPKIEGYGAVFYDGTPATEYVLWEGRTERVVERIMRTAFANALTRGDDVRGLFNHDPNQVLGRTSSATMTLSVDERGLAYSILPGDTTVSRDVQEYLKRKDVTGSSFSFSVEEERWTETKDGDKWFAVRDIISVKPLYDVGPVTFPAYTSTSASVRAAGDCVDARSSLEKHKSGLAAKLRNYDTRARLVELGLA
jgi:HK97 family phage prohead protease